VKHILTGLALAAAASVATAGDLELSLHGGAVNQTTTLSFDGDANAPYMLLFDIQESAVYVNPNVTLAIAPTFASISALVPGFVGTLDGQGSAQSSVILPNDPFLLATTVSFQAVSGNPLDSVSNLIRLTAATAGTFEPTLDAPDLPIIEGTAAAGDDGVMFIGGSGPVAQRYDPNLEEWSLSGAAFSIGALGQSTALADGRILFTGGIGLNGQPTTAAAVYDPQTQLSTTITMNQSRAGHGASLLPDGRVLITGGFKSLDLTDLLTFLTGVQGDTELFDPNTGTFAAGPTMLEPRALHTSTTTSSGGVLIAGGLTIIPIISIPTVSNTSYLFNNGSFGLPSFFAGARMMHSACALDNGDVLLAGGLSIDFSQVIQSGDLTQLVIGTLDDGQVYSSGIFGGSYSTVNGMASGRAGAGVISLGGGDALIVGGLDVSLSTGGVNVGALSSADLYTGGGTFSPTGSMAEARTFPVLTALPDGTVLVAGGGPVSAEVYQP